MTGWKLRRAELFQQNRGRYLHDHSTLFPAPMRRLIGNAMDLESVAQETAFDEADCAADTAQLIADIETYLADDLLLLLDKTSMAASVEGRVPMLDHHLVELALAVPPEIRAPQGQAKGLLREIAGDFLPPPVVEAPKQGFASPVQAWMGSGMVEVARRLLTNNRTLGRGWWTSTGIEKLLAKPERHAFHLYALLMLELSVRIHVESALPSVPDVGMEDLLAEL
jgi:asparagine synthase (glutamine-hydrolysing)